MADTNSYSNISTDMYFQGAPLFYYYYFRNGNNFDDKKVIDCQHQKKSALIQFQQDQGKRYIENELLQKNRRKRYKTADLK